MVMSQTAADLYAKARQRRNAIEKGDKKKAAQYTHEYNDIASRPNSGVRGSNTSGFAENEYWDRDTQSYVPEPEPQPQHRQNPHNQVKSTSGNINQGQNENKDFWGMLSDAWNSFAKSRAEVDKANIDSQVQAAQDLTGTISRGVGNAVKIGAKNPVPSSSGVVQGQPSYTYVATDINHDYDEAYNQLAEQDDIANADNEEWRQAKEERSPGIKDLGASISFSNKHSIDDGSSTNMANRTSNWMTGQQYIKYRNAGIPGRDVNDIDPDATYSKVDEMQNQGFVPYVPDEAARAQLLAAFDASTPAKLLNELAHARENLTDYTINYNDMDISGREFDDKATNYLNNANALYETFVESLANGNESFYNNPDDAGEGAVPIKFSDAIWNIGGQDYNVRSRTDPDIDVGGDGIIRFSFPDTGETIEVADTPDGIDYLNTQRPTFVLAENPDEAEAWMATGINDLILNNGQRLNYNQVRDIYNGEGSRDYGPFNIGKPTYDVNAITEEGGAEDFLPWVTDLMLGSAPLFTIPTSIMQGFSNAAIASGGVDPRQIDMEGESKRSHEGGQTDDQYLGSIVGHAIQPATEQLMGRVGILKPFTRFVLPKLTERLGERAWMPLASHAAETLGEGVEEIFPGQPVEDLQQNGFQNLFANDVLDENGDVLYDRSGHAVKDSNTSFMDRLNNWAQGMGENFAGGAILGGILGLPSARNAIKRSRALKAKNAYTKKAGAGVEREGKQPKDDLWVDIDNLRVADEEE